MHQKLSYGWEKLGAPSILAKIPQRTPSCLTGNFGCLTDTGEDSKLAHRRQRPKVDTSIFFSFFRRVRATSALASVTQRRVENTLVHFWTFLPVSTNSLI